MGKKKAKEVEQVNHYKITAKELVEVVNFDKRDDPEQLNKLNDKGNVKGISELLETNLETGLNKDEAATNYEKRVASFGCNSIPPPEIPSVFRMAYEQVKEDAILKILLVGATVNLVLGLALSEDRSKGWLEGVAIFIAVLIVLTVTSGNNWLKERKFQKILLLQSNKQVKVVRAGEFSQISSHDLVVGDLVQLEPGDEIPADGLYVHGKKISVDESPLTGETIPVKKSDIRPYLFSGTQVSEGSGTMLVTSVGPNSTGGQIQALLNEQTKQETPLQEKLSKLAEQIGLFGIAAGIICFVGLAIRWVIIYAIMESWKWNHLTYLVEYFVLGVTIVVVAVPEGLPLAVTIALAYSMMKMIKDQNFVRHLSASETMGEATCVCSDKTGTLTENRMTVVKSYIAGLNTPEATALSKPVLDLLHEAVAVNSTCKITEIDGPSPNFVGNKTEGALLMYSRKLGGDYEAIRGKFPAVAEYPFTSDRKRMSTIIQIDNESTPFRLHCKGAAEIILSLCSSAINAQGQKIALDKPAMEQLIDQMANEGLRTITLAYRELRAKPKDDAPADLYESELVFLGITGIKDPLRVEVPDSVRKCQIAGMKVRMVTGDNILTARHIAKECGILTDGIAMEGPKFRVLSETEMEEVIPKLQVLARSSPQDKFLLVSKLKKMGEVVAVTGDGTNDAPALKEADVGFAMGISGTDVAKNASDIVLLDDNFCSIVKATLWGRNVFDCIRKFLQFQLAVNVSAIVIVIAGAFVYGVSPLNPVQLLWINLVMDTLGALALATDPPDEDILERPPHKRRESIVTISMLYYVALQSIYQVTVCLFILFYFHTVLGVRRANSDENRTLVFCVFAYFQIFNEFSARTLGTSINVFKGINRNPYFVVIMVFIAVVQFLLVQYAGFFVKTTGLSVVQWVVCLAIAASLGVWGVVIRLILKLRLFILRKDTEDEALVEEEEEEVKEEAKEEEAPVVQSEEVEMKVVPALENKDVVVPIDFKSLGNTHWAKLRAAVAWMCIYYRITGQKCVAVKVHDA